MLAGVLLVGVRYTLFDAMGSCMYIMPVFCEMNMGLPLLSNCGGVEALIVRLCIPGGGYVDPL